MKNNTPNTLYLVCHPPTHHIPTGCGSCFANRGKGTRKSNLGERKAGRLHTRQETQNLRLKKITDDKGPIPIRFERDNKKTLMPLADHASHWSNYLGELIREMPLYYPSWQKVSADRKATILTKTGMERSTTREYPSLIHTFFMTQTVNGVFTWDEDRSIYEEMLRLQALGSNTSSGVPYTEEEINAWVKREISGGTFPVLVGYYRDGTHMSLFRLLRPRLNARSTPAMSKSLKRRTTGVAGAGMMRWSAMRTAARMRRTRRMAIVRDVIHGLLEKVTWESILSELFPSTYPEGHVAQDPCPQRQVARKGVDLSLGKVPLLDFDSFYAIMNSMCPESFCRFGGSRIHVSFAPPPHEKERWREPVADSRTGITFLLHTIIPPKNPTPDINSCFSIPSHSWTEACMEVLLAKERILKLIQTWDDKQIESWSLPELLLQLLNDSRTIDEMLKQREQTANLAVQQEQAAQIFTPYWNFSMSNDDEEHSIPYKEYLKNSSNAITTVLPTEEPEYSLSMRYKHLSTIPEMESDEVIKSSVKNLVQIPREYEVTSDNESECDVPVYEDPFDVLKDHSEILSDSNNDDTSSDDDAFEDIKYVEASLLNSELVSLEEENDVYQEEKEFDLEDIHQIQDVVLHEKLLSINCPIADIEFLNDNPAPDRVLKSSSSFPIFEKSDISLSYSDNSLPEFEIFSDPTEETRSGSTTAHANNSPLDYDSFCFETELDQERLTNVVMNDIFDNSTNDPLLEEVDLFLVSDNSIPPGIENIDYDSEGDIHFLKELLSNDFLPLPKNESSNFDHHDPSFPHPPLEPPDVEVFFNFEPNLGELISVVMNNIDELNKDECFDPGGGEIDVFANIKDDDYFPFIFVIRIFLPYLIYPKVSPLLLSIGSEDTISDPGIST
nr:hypothetical protein [Tanacetum cinerariifolium]